MKIDTYNKYLEKKDFKNIISHYNKIIKKNKPYYNNVLYIHIISYYKIYFYLFKNTNLNLSTNKIMILILSSFSNILNDDKINNDKLIIQIKENNIYNLYNSSIKILITTYKLLRILHNSLNNYYLLFNKNNFQILILLKDYLNNKKITMYQYNNMFKTKLYIDIIDYIKKN
jgi:hypothetical protein